jgi:uncharacterized membrane protein YccF (DUF307 family)
MSTSDSLVYGLKIALLGVWAAPWTIVALALCISVLGIPLAIPCAWIGCYPLYRVVLARHKAVQAYRDRDHPLENEGEVPWNI